MASFVTLVHLTALVTAAVILLACLVGAARCSIQNFRQQQER